MIGMFAVSKAGHDKGKIYIIIEETEEYVYLADGVLKTLEKPKKKKKKHIQIIKKQMEQECSIVRNEGIKRAIKLYRAAEGLRR